MKKKLVVAKKSFVKCITLIFARLEFISTEKK